MQCNYDLLAYKDYKDKKFDRTQLREAILIQDKLQLFSVPFTDFEFRSCYMDEYLKKMKKKIANEKAYSRFKESIPYPLPTVEFVETIFNSLSKVFNGDGRSIEFNPEGKYTSLSFEDLGGFWNRFKFAPNSFVVTLEHEKETYRYFVDVRNLDYIKFEDNDIFEFGYKNGDETIYITEKEFIVYENETINKEKSYTHNFGFCPVDFLSNKKLSHSKPLIRVNNIVSSLGDIEELLSISIQSNVINRYILPYLIEAKKTGADAGCQYTVGDNYCNEGYLYQRQEATEDEFPQPKSLLSNGVPIKCPQCNKETGFGSVLEIPARNLMAEDFEKVIGNILNFKYLDVQSLEFPSKKRKELETEIYNKIVNKQESLNNSQQHNETRVQATFEDKTAVLMNLKRVFENILSRLITKDLKIKSKSYKSTYVSLGSKFYLNSAEECQQLITKAKENGTIDYVDYDRGLIEARYSENKLERNRNIFLLELERAIKPYRNLTYKDVVELRKQGQIEKGEFDMHVNFMKKVRELEMEKQMSVLDMFPAEKLDKQILLIKNLLQ